MKVETPLLRRLGPVPFWRGEKRCLDALDDIYRRAAEKAKRLLAADATASAASAKPHAARDF